MRNLIPKLTFFTLLCLCLTKLAIAQTPTPDFSATLVEGCSPLVVSFSDQSLGNPTTWFWEFGNGATSSLKNPSTTFFTPGTYTIKLTVTNTSGSKTLTRSDFITVYGNPQATFKGSDSVGCYPFPVNFTDQTIASPGTTNTNWMWDLGDGTQSTLQNPQNTYLNTGNYTVSVKVTNDKGCWSVATKPAYVKIDGGVVADFSFISPISCRTPFNIRFINNSKGPGNLTYQWIFGDGATSTEANPTHTYTTTGIYTVMLVTKSSNGCTDTLKKQNIFNLTNTITSFSVPDSVCAKEAVTFSNTSSTGATSTFWDFGDGSTSSVFSPVKAFTQPGIYSVKLVQTYGICADSVTKSIKILARPTASFTSDKTVNCQVPFTVNFRNTSTNAVAYAWSFGDNTTSTEANPTHTYTSYGNYDVTLIATNASGCTDTFKIPGYIKVNKPVIQFNALPQNGCIPYGVAFSAAINTPDNVTSYLWDFGNGATSTAATPYYTYNEQGTFTVKLTITTANGCTESLTMPEAVKVGRKPVVNFYAVSTRVCAFQEVNFVNLTNEGTSWQWDFGDGNTSSAFSPNYQYNDTGTFSVRLIADNNGCIDSFSIPRYVTVKPPIARFFYKPNCDNKLVYQFRDSSIGAGSWEWNFGDGKISNERHPKHIFPGDGTYTVTLTVSNDSCFHQQKKVIKIFTGTPDFRTSPSSVCKGTTISFIADSTNAENLVSYQWNFGHGGAPGSGMTTSTFYPDAGLYTVSLFVTDIYGCVDSTVKAQSVLIKGPTAAFTAFNNNGCKGLQASFTDASKDDGKNKINQWLWNFGDGTIMNNSSGLPVQHTYHNSGSYGVSLKVTDEGGCADSLYLPALVNTSAIKADFFSKDTVSCPGATIRFVNTSSTLTDYTSIWSFGDGSSSLENNPSTAYGGDGRYTVQLKIWDAYGCTDSMSRVEYISINHPVASYTVSDSASICTPFQVKFTNTSTYHIQHMWDLAGGSSRMNNPTQFYNSPGIYKTKLIVTSPGGCTDTATKDIKVYDAGATKISYLPLSGCKPLTVELKASSPVKMDYVWDFGDGTIISNNDTVSTHVYNFFGDFVPKVIMKNAGGCVVPVTGLETIHIKGATAKFGLDKSLFCDSGMVRFSDSTTFNNPITSYTWSFGDGTTSSLASPSHRYTQPGNYNVSLNVTTQNLCVDTFRLSYPVKVVASPVVHIAGDSVICAGEGLAHFGMFDRADTSAVRWAWRFPNGKSATSQIPQRQIYNEAGSFVVQTIATNSSGCKDTAFQSILVNPLPSVILPSSITTMVGTPVLIPALYSDTMRTYQWNVQDGLDCPTCPRPIASPKFNTRYKVQFVDENGCRNTGEVQVIVLCNNDNVFVPNTFSPNGDGSNDIFYVRGKGLSRVKTLRIFNRWGQVVFERNNFSVNDPSMGWDGRVNNAKATPDVYVYQVEIFCDNSQVVKFEGNVALIQ